MKNQELIDLLSKMDREAPVILQQDLEGNGFSPALGAVEGDIYVAKSIWYGVVYDAKEAEEEDIEGETCIVIWPMS